MEQAKQTNEETHAKVGLHQKLSAYLSTIEPQLNRFKVTSNTTANITLQDKEHNDADISSGRNETELSSITMNSELCRKMRLKRNEDMPQCFDFLNKTEGLQLPEILPQPPSISSGGALDFNWSEKFRDIFQNTAEWILKKMRTTNEMGCVHPFVWDLWRNKEAKPYSTRSSSLQVQESETCLAATRKIAVTLSSEAVLCLLRFLYTGEMTGEPKHLMEILAKCNHLNFDKLVYDSAYQQLMRSTDIQSLNEMWANVDGTCQDQDQNSALVKSTLAFIITNPDEALNWRFGLKGLPRHVMEQLHPSRLSTDLLKDVSYLTAKVYYGLDTPANEAVYLRTDHLMLAEYVYMWGLEQIFKTKCYSGFPNRKDVFVSMKELLDVIGDISDVIDRTCSFTWSPHIRQSFDSEGKKYCPMERNRRSFFLLVLNNEIRISDADLQQNNAVHPYLPFYAQETKSPERKGKQEVIRYKRQASDRSDHFPTKIQVVEYPPGHVSSRPLGRKISENPLLNRLRDHFNCKTSADVVIFTEPHTPPIYVHSFVLSMWSSVFRNHFDGNLSSKMHSFCIPGLKRKFANIFFQSFYKGYDMNLDGSTNDVIMSLSLLFQCPVFVHTGIKKARTTADYDRPDRLIMLYEAERMLGEYENVEKCFSEMSKNLEKVFQSLAFQCIAHKDTILKMLECPRNMEMLVVDGIIRWDKMQTLLSKEIVDVSGALCEFKKFINFSMLDRMDILELVKRKFLNDQEACEYSFQIGVRLALERNAKLKHTIDLEQNRGTKDVRKQL